jgi:pimeloyl-ACP methyl ester carboxylesterase
MTPSRRRLMLCAFAWTPAVFSGCAQPGGPRAAADASPDAAMTFRRITLPDGRVAEVALGGDPMGHALVLHHGTPGDATTFADWHAPCAARGLRLICMSRAGYAASTRLRGRTVAQAADDIAAVLDAMGHRRFVTAGWSGGGPHALACVARLPGRCLAAATLAGVGPYGVSDLDFLAGMGQENIDEFGAALKGEAVLRQWLIDNGESLRSVTGPQLADAFGDLVSPVDKSVLTGGYADALAAVFRRALQPGFDGWIDDDLAFVKDWGFRLDEIRAPVAVWQGELDRMVPFAHGRWLQRHVPGARAHLVPAHGHLSLVAQHREEILNDLLARSRAAA